MHIAAVVGSPRKGRATDTLVDRAVEGAKTRYPDGTVAKINLAEYDIQYCLQAFLRLGDRVHQGCGPRFIERENRRQPICR